MQLAQQQFEHVVVITISGDLSDHGPAIHELSERLLPLVKAIASQGKSVIVDLSTVEGINSIASRCLVTAAKEMESAGLRMALAALLPIVSEKLTIGRIDKVMPFYATVDEAVRALS